MRILDNCREDEEHSENRNSAKMVKQKHISCMLLNAQSIRSKFDEFRCRIALQRPDIICATETWVSEEFCGDRLQDFEVPGYNLFSYSRESRRGGGVFLYVNALFRSGSVNDSSKSKEVESIWVDICFDSGKRKELRIGAFYRPGNLLKEPQSEADQAICDEIRRHFKPGCIILGDFNLPRYEERNETDECVDFKQLFEEDLFMHQFVTEPTRSSSILDLVFSDSRDMLYDFEITEGLGKSDHNTVQFKISASIMTRDNLLLVPDFNRANFDKLRKDLTQIEWKKELTALDACEAWDIFRQRLDEVQKRHIPFRHKRRSKKDRPSWLTPEVRQAIISKKEAFKTMKTSPVESNIKIYQKHRNEVKRAVRAAKRAKELDLARNCKGDTKKFFSFYKMSSASKAVGPIKMNDLVFDKDSEMIELFSDQFRSVYTIEDQREIGMLNPQPLTQESIDDLDHISAELVRGYLKKLKANKAEGPDDIYARVLNECEKELAAPLAIIFSKSIKESKIPLDWKRANVIPIFKKGDKTKVENYRPVSLTSIVCKVLESIIKDNIVKFLEENNLIRDTQHGFRTGHSCLTNLLNFFKCSY